jgi:putative glycosyltransferase
MKLSIVATLYQSAPYIEEFCRRATKVACEIAGDDHEIILVNDGSLDDSLAHAVRISKANPRLTVIDLSRNFGQHRAMMAGLRHARGDLIFLIDSDLEEEPEWLTRFFAQMAADGCDVVFGVQQTRKGNWFERLSGSIYYSAVRAVTGFNMPKNTVTARLMTRDYLDALLQHDEREIFMSGLWWNTGFDQRPHLVNKHSTSKTTYTLRRKVAMSINALTSFSSAPLMAIFYLGLVISFGAGLYTAYLVINWLFHARTPGGWTSVMASIWLLGGLLILFVGIVGIYLSKVFLEVKRRPHTIVRKIYGRENR